MSEFKNTRISERKFYRIEPIALMADGGVDGEITVPSTYCFKVSQKITLRSDTHQPRVYKVKKVISETEILVGDFEKPITEYADVTDFIVADNAVIVLPEQNRPSIDPVNIQGMVFEEEPTVALRNHQVDWLGRSYDASNPMPVQLSDGNIDIGTVNAELEVQLSHQDNVPDAGDVADSVQVGDGTETLAINPDGSINVAITPIPPGNYTPKSTYNEVGSVANSSLTTVTTYTVPVGKTASLNSADVSGSNIATYTVEINATVVDKKYTWFGGQLSERFNFTTPSGGSQQLVAGDVVRVRVEHGRPMVGSFNAKIDVVEIS